MGVKNLSKLLKDNNIKPSKTNLRDLKNKIFAIDTSNFMYKFNHGYAFKTPIEGFLAQIFIFLSNNITPVYIFDGKPPDEKKEEVEKRKEDRNKLKEYYKNQIDVCDDEIELIKLNDKLEKLDGITQKKFEELKQLLDIFNIKYIVSNEEADDICKVLNNYRLIDFSVSEDKDFLLNNKYTISKLNTFNGTCEVWDRDDILNGLDISMNTFIDLCILLGCDYCNTIPKVGLKTSWKFIKKYGNIEDIIKNETKYDTSNFKYIDARLRLQQEFTYIFENFSKKNNFYIKEFNKENISEKLKELNLYEKYKNKFEILDKYQDNINNSIINYI